MFTRDKELTVPVKLCDENGLLLPESMGWSRKPLHICNLTGRWPRKKKWNHWLITTENFLFNVTLVHLDYAVTAFTYFFDCERKQFLERTVTIPLAVGCHFPENIDGDITFTSKLLQYSIRQDQDYTRIKVDRAILGKQEVSAEFHIKQVDGCESLNVVIPWDKLRFHYTSKQNCLPAEGRVVMGQKSYDFVSGKAFAALDVGRGVWPYKSFWNWATCSGMQQDRVVGLNLGAGWTDGTGINENAWFVDGRVTKIAEDVCFTYDSANIMEPWHIQTPLSQAVNLTFTPFSYRTGKTNLLVVKSELKQVFGHYSGEIVTEQQERIRIDKLIGCVEEHHARW